IDIFNHFLPRPYLDAVGEKHPAARFAAGIRHAWDMEERLRLLEPWPELQQVITLSQCTPERVGGPELSPKLARIANDGMAEIGDARSEDPRYATVRERMRQRSIRPIDYFRKFYADTAVCSAAALRCGLDFFGADHVVFATDFPFGPDGGVLFLTEGIRAVD